LSDAFWRTIEYSAVLSVVITTIVGAFIAFFTTFILRRKSDSRYDEVLRRAEISEMRKSYEEQIKNLTLQLTATDQRWKDLNHLLLSSQRFEAREPAKYRSSEFLRAMGIAEEVRIDPKLVLLLTPFSPDFQESYLTIVEACRRVGLVCVRGDEEDAHGDILSHILRIMIRSRLVIANIGSRNPNVFYELGIAHALDKSTILVSETISDVPFDIQSKRILIYKSLDELKDALPEMLARALAVQATADGVQSNQQSSQRAPFVAALPGDGIGLLRTTNTDYLCITDQGEAIFLPAGPYVFLRLIPKYSRDSLGDTETYRIAQANLRPMQGRRTGAWRMGRHESGTIAYVPNPANPRLALDAAQLFMSGELWANDFYFLDPTRERMKEQGFAFVPTGAIEEISVDTLRNFVAIAQNQLNFELPVEIKVGMVGVQNYRLAVDERYFAFSQFEGRILRTAITYDTQLNSWTASPLDALKPFFERIYDAAGIRRPDTGESP
jgi:hypothetical protein